MHTNIRGLGILGIVALFCLSPQAHAQTGIAHPQNIVCQTVNDFGVITDRSIEEPHKVIMQLDPRVEDSITYSGVTENRKDSGGGESVNVSYDLTTGKLLNGTSGIVCPPNLLP